MHQLHFLKSVLPRKGGGRRGWELPFARVLGQALAAIALVALLSFAQPRQTRPAARPASLLELLA